MSLLPLDVHTELTELLRLLQSPNGDIRKQAEDHLQTNWTAPQPQILLMGLAEQIQAAAEPSMRSFAAVIFRRIILKQTKDEKGVPCNIFLSFPKEQATAIRQKLLETLLSESNSQARNMTSDAVAELARQYAEKGEIWNELLTCLFQLSLAPDAKKRETAYRVFTASPNVIEAQHEDAIITAFAKGFKDDNASVRLSALKAFTSFFRIVEKKAWHRYQILIPDVLNILPPLKQSQDLEDLSDALVSLIELASIAPKMFKSQFHDLVAFCVSMIQEKELGDNCRQNALELLTTFSDEAVSMCRKEPLYTEQMITQCLSLMTEVGEDDEDGAKWLAVDNPDQDDANLNHVAGEQTMDRLANNLGGPTILAPIFVWLPRMMTSVAWRDRHAALMAISAISEGCRDLMMGELSQVLDLVISALSNAQHPHQPVHPRVRWAGCQALGQMSTDFSPTIQEKFGDMVLKAIISVFDSSDARVKAHAAAALVNFCEEAKKPILVPHLDNLLSHLFRLLQNEKRYAQEQALSTIATIADAAQAAFSKYYDTLMPLLVNVLRQDPNKEIRLLRSKAMECATLIALAVGAEKLGNDAYTLMGLLANIQESITDADDPQAQYLMHCWGRMCRVVGHDFVKYLPTVMLPLLEVATAKCDVVLLEDDEHIEQVQQEDGWELVPIKGKMLGIKTSMMDDKHMVIELLVVYAQVLEDSFAPYAPEIMNNVAIPGLMFFFHDPVRVVSAKLVPYLLNCCKKAYGPQSPQVASLWSTTVDKLLEVLEADLAADTLAEMYQSFYESVEVLGKDCLTEDHMSHFIDASHAVLNDYKERVAERDVNEQDETDDAEDDAEEMQLAKEDDQALLSDMNKAFHSIFKNHGTLFLKAWERLLNVYQDFLVSPDPSQRQWGLCIMDDVLEYCGHESIRYKDIMALPFEKGCGDQSPAIRQAAAYGIGEAARRGGPGWAHFLAHSLPLLFQVTQIPDATEENAYATENACVAIAKILHFNSSHVSEGQAVAGQWIETLPITNDAEGAPYAYAYLADLINQQHPAVFSNATKIFGHVAAVLDANILKGEMVRRIVESTKALLTSCGIDATPLLEGFSQESQEIIKRHFS